MDFLVRTRHGGSSNPEVVAKGVRKGGASNRCGNGGVDNKNPFRTVEYFNKSHTEN